MRNSGALSHGVDVAIFENSLRSTLLRDDQHRPARLFGCNDHTGHELSRNSVVAAVIAIPYVTRS